MSADTSDRVESKSPVVAELRQRLKGKLVLFTINDPAFLLSHRLNLVEAVRSLGARVGILAPEGPATARLRDGGFDVFPVPLSRWGHNPFFELKTQLSLVKRYRELRPTIVHHITIKPIVYGSIAAWFARVPYTVNAVTGLGLVYTGVGILSAFRRFAINLIYKVVLPRINQRMIFQHEADRGYFVSRGYVAIERTSIIPGAGVDGELFSPAPAGSSEVTVLFASRLLVDKGILEFIQAASRIKKEVPGVRFLVAGEFIPGHPLSISEETLKKAIQSGAIEYLGKVEDMPNLIRSAHLVCLPTFYGEGIPKFLVESLASGKPIVTSDLPGNRQVVTNGGNGILVPSRNASALANAVLRLVQDSATRELYGLNSRAYFERGGFSEKVVVENTLRVYQQLLRSEELKSKCAA